MTVIEGIYLPSNLRSPAKDGRELINNEESNGTEIGTFMPTWTKPNSSQIRSGKPINQNYQNSIKHTIPIINRFWLAYFVHQCKNTDLWLLYCKCLKYMNIQYWTNRLLLCVLFLAVQGSSIQFYNILPGQLQSQSGIFLQPHQTW